MDPHALSVRTPIVARGSGGRQAVAAAAYVRGEVARDYVPGETEGESGTLRDYHRKAGEIEARGTLLPANAPAFLATASVGQRWRWVEASEDAYWDKRLRRRPEDAEVSKAKAQIAIAGHISLANELTPEQAEETARRVLDHMAVSRGAIVDFAIHRHKGNLHCDFIMSMRRVGPEGVEAKLFREKGGGDIREWLEDVRRYAAEAQNEALQAAGISRRVEHLSHKARGLKIEPGVHVGPAADGIEKRGAASGRALLNEAVARRNAAKIDGDAATAADEIVSRLNATEATITEAQIAKKLFDRTGGDEEIFNRALPKVMADPRLVRIGTDTEGKARYSTADYMSAEARMFSSAATLIDRGGPAVSEAARVRVIEEHFAYLNNEQRQAVAHFTDGKGFALANAGAGTGKTTLMKAVQAVHLAEHPRRQIRGAAVAWKAAKLLEKETGIRSQSVASLTYAIESWQAVQEAVKAGRLEKGSPAYRRAQRNYETQALGKGDVLIIDEVGQLSTRQWDTLESEALRRGWSLYGIGDAHQYGSIGAGRYAALVERFGAAELQKINRQQADAEDVLHHITGQDRRACRAIAAGMSEAERDALVREHLKTVHDEGRVWRREASANFRNGNTRAALTAYSDRGFVHFEKTADAQRQALVKRYFKLADHGMTDQAVYAFRNTDRRMLNDLIRAERQRRGEIGADAMTIDGRQYAGGDRVIILENDRTGAVYWPVNGKPEPVYNNTEATVLAADAESGVMTLRLEDGRVVRAHIQEIAASGMDHAYCQTTYKSQGQTHGDLKTMRGAVHIFGTGHLDAPGIHVAMTRSRYDTHLYLSREEFSDLNAVIERFSKAPARDLVADYINGDEAAVEKVRKFKALGREMAETMRAIKDSGRADAPWEHPAWEAVAAAKVERKALAEEFFQHTERYTQPLRSGRVTWERVEIAAGRRQRPLTEAEETAKARMLAFGKQAGDVRQQWGGISLSHPGARSRSHPDFSAYDGARQARDAQAAELAADRARYRPFVKDAGISWTAVEKWAEVHKQRQAEAERLASMTPEDRAALEAVREYRQTRKEAAAAFATGDRAEGVRLAERRDELAAQITDKWQRHEGHAGAERIDDKLIDHAAAHDGRALVAIYKDMAAARMTATAGSLAREIVQTAAAEKIAGRRHVAVAVATAGIDWKDIRQAAREAEIARLPLADQVAERRVAEYRQARTEAGKTWRVMWADVGGDQATTEAERRAAMRRVEGHESYGGWQAAIARRDTATLAIVAEPDRHQPHFEYHDVKADALAHDTASARQRLDAAEAHNLVARYARARAGGDEHQAADLAAQIVAGSDAQRDTGPRHLARAVVAARVNWREIRMDARQAEANGLPPEERQAWETVSRYRTAKAEAARLWGGIWHASGGDAARTRATAWQRAEQHPDFPAHKAAAAARDDAVRVIAAAPKRYEPHLRAQYIDKATVAADLAQADRRDASRRATDLVREYVAAKAGPATARQKSTVAAAANRILAAVEAEKKTSGPRVTAQAVFAAGVDWRQLRAEHRAELDRSARLQEAVDRVKAAGAALRPTTTETKTMDETQTKEQERDRTEQPEDRERRERQERLQREAVLREHADRIRTDPATPQQQRKTGELVHTPEDEDRPKRMTEAEKWRERNREIEEHRAEAEMRAKFEGRPNDHEEWLATKREIWEGLDRHEAEYYRKQALADAVEKMRAAGVGLRDNAPPQAQKPAAETSGGPTEEPANQAEKTDRGEALAAAVARMQAAGAGLRNDAPATQGTQPTAQKPATETPGGSTEKPASQAEKPPGPRIRV